ncbi:MAG: hypothetical protein A3I39_00310 [Candidatus Yanofskybacteria bacterium RIFCSPLOWO2_02_FULL_47_9b]|uniref:Uncharacterized protein n=1 Tax=Candidatus Yanofskybacteria bacterium RIFCSPLOWO2_02_FULL_47_9b TaxID=1802708 RepID=A0A1F8HAC9_9BACT|nr:MAG: hypothetical protein A3I39_00310 [Candidatus Yanofskybacteria bacterium RIFCSPLOWO2_02_FULL_47_9b]
MNKKLLIVVLIVVVLGLVGGAYYYWKTKVQKTAAQRAADISTEIGNNVSPDVTTPVVNLPDTNANPYSKTNPFSNLKTNPFQ